MGAQVIDILIRGDRVVTANGVGAWDIAVAGEKILSVAAPGTVKDADAGRVIDARGKIVIPGGIDPHIHCKFGQPGGHVRPLPDQVSRAALFRGTTTVLGFVQWAPGETLQQSIEKRDAASW